jgi:hypothetical protein
MFDSVPTVYTRVSRHRPRFALHFRSQPVQAAGQLATCVVDGNRLNLRGLTTRAQDASHPATRAKSPTVFSEKWCILDIAGRSLKLAVQHRAVECSHLRLALSISPNNSYVRFRTRTNSHRFGSRTVFSLGGSSATFRSSRSAGDATLAPSVNRRA